MGNGNCCPKDQPSENDFNIPISDARNSLNYKIQNSSNLNNSEKKEDSNLNSKKSNLVVSEFDYSFNSKNDFANYVVNYKQDNAIHKFNKLLKKETFGCISKNYGRDLIIEINNIRKNPLEFSERLIYYADNFNLIEDIVNKFENEDLKKYFSRTKEDFKEAASFFKKLHEKYKEGLSELIEIEEFQCPIFDDMKEIISKKFSNKFRSRFKSKFKDVFQLKLHDVRMILNDPKIGLLFYFSRKLKKWDKFFIEENSYVGLNFKENIIDTNVFFISFVLARKI